MRIRSIQLAWFRGAAEPVSLDLDCKSIVVYGTNGSGKSSFVDAIEYVLNEGKIGHLSHEYSGKRQEKAIPNTHRPQGRKTEVAIKFKDNSEYKVEIQPDGSRTNSSGEPATMPVWDYRRTVLRQNEVAEFIHDTKGDKYSALLPLLGLHHTELAAENLRQLTRIIENDSALKMTKNALKQVEETRKKVFGNHSNGDIINTIEKEHAKYCVKKAVTNDVLSRCQELESALDTRIARFTADDRRHVALQNVAALSLSDHIHAVRSARLKLSGALDPLIAEKLQVLSSTGSFVAKLGKETQVECPACGRLISTDVFRDHVLAEGEHLQGIIKTFGTWKDARGTLCDTLKSIKSSLTKLDLKTWRDELPQGALAESFIYTDGMNVETLRETCSEEDLNAFESKLLPLITAATSHCQDAPPDVQALSSVKRIAEAGKAIFSAIPQAAAVARFESLISFVNLLEQGVREEIRLRANTVVDEISTDIMTMWVLLHPGEDIESIHLYLPNEADKAIDIGLKFYGVEQNSPRLTLSEGYRNSLGLCIFMAMAKREADTDRPLFLDDVVVSLDRNHRGMIQKLLAKEFSGRQVILLTHDREWYTEMRQQLDGKNWVFKALLPYDSPNIGIRWSHKTTTFADARDQVKERPDSAGNDARKIMDIELSLIAERLQIPLPYRRADKNDRRGAHEFLERLIAVGRKDFQRKDGKAYSAHIDAIIAFSDADRLLISWGNRASHTFDVVPSEVTKLIDACEKCLEQFKCLTCGKFVWFAETDKRVQCECSAIRWG